MGEQIVGYYDVERGQLVVRDDVMRAFEGKAQTRERRPGRSARRARARARARAAGSAPRPVVATSTRKRDSDADNAFRALIEGDATLAMIAYSLERESMPLRRAHAQPGARAQRSPRSCAARRSPAASSAARRAIVRVPLLVRVRRRAHVRGLSARRRRLGACRSRAQPTPPQSTEQVLHPERFARHEAPERPRLPSPRDALGAGYELLHEDTLGELEMRVYFGAAAQEAAAQHAAQGWGGDRLYAYRGADQKVAIVWLTIWDDEREAREAEQAAERVAATAAASARARTTGRARRPRRAGAAPGAERAARRGTQALRALGDQRRRKRAARRATRVRTA